MELNLSESPTRSVRCIVKLGLFVLLIPVLVSSHPLLDLDRIFSFFFVLWEDPNGFDSDLILVLSTYLCRRV